MTRALCLAAVLALGVCTAAAQEGESASPYFDCPYINYFDPDCPQLERDEPQAQVPVDEEAERAEVEAEEDTEHDWLQEVPEHLLPLFPKQSVAPDTPDLYRLLLLRPTLANARRYVRWYSRRMERIAEAQRLIGLAGGEFLAGGRGE